MRKNNNDLLYDENVNYDSLEEHTYEDAPGYTFYTCPKCGREYLASFIINDEGETMCIDCLSENSRF